jgi:hypothetical protein
MLWNRLALLALLAAPAGLQAAEMPPPPPPGAPLQERLYIASDSADDIVLLLARVTCVAYQRARIDARLEAGLLARGWSGEVDRLWRLSQALAAFEAAHIRPMIDAETEEVLLAAYAPDTATGTSAEGPPETGPDSARTAVPAAAEDPRALRCLSFGDAFLLRRAL